MLADDVRDCGCGEHVAETVGTDEQCGVALQRLLDDVDELLLVLTWGW